MQPRPKSCGVHRHDVNTRSRLVLFVSVMPWCRQSLQPGILVSTSTPASPWGPKSSTPSERVLQHCARSVAWHGLSLSQHALLTVIRTLVITKLDQCNSDLVGTSVYLQDRLQSVLNAAARLVYSRQTSEHTSWHNPTATWLELHWLRVLERIQFRLCVLAYHCVHGTAPAYIPVWQPAADIRDRRSSMSPLCWHHDTTSSVDSSGYPWAWRPCLSGGCSACMEHFCH